MLSHQIGNSLNQSIFSIYKYRNVPFDKHFHRAYELIYVTEGTLTVTILSKSFSVPEGSCCLISPYAIHSFSGNATHIVVVFSETYVESFTKRFGDKTSDYPIFPLSPHTVQYFQASLTPYHVDLENHNPYPYAPPSILIIKSILYAICAEYTQKCDLRDRFSGNNSWFTKMLLFVEQNYTQDITLRDVAKQLGYNYEYISREFNNILGINFKSLLNQYRCERARYLIETTDENMTQIAEMSGFQSIRSFNRSFKEQMGITPSELKKNRLTTLPHLSIETNPPKKNIRHLPS